MVRNEGATHIGVAFDHTVESFRNDLFDGYKVGDGMDPDLWAQFGPAEDMTRALGMVVWPMVEFEADDALATAAARFAADSRVEQVRICTPDKDLAQCVHGVRVVCVDRRRKRVMDEAGVEEKFAGDPVAAAPGPVKGAKRPRARRQRPLQEQESCRVCAPWTRCESVRFFAVLRDRRGSAPPRA